MKLLHAPATGTSVKSASIRGFPPVTQPGASVPALLTVTCTGGSRTCDARPYIVVPATFYPARYGKFKLQVTAKLVDVAAERSLGRVALSNAVTLRNLDWSLQWGHTATVRYHWTGTDVSRSAWSEDRRLAREGFSWRRVPQSGHAEAA